MSSVITTKNKIILIIILGLLFILFPLIGQSINVNQIPNPRTTNGTWVTDMANILSDNTEIQINQMIDQLEATNGTEIAVVTVPETQPAHSPKEFTTELFNTWKIGKVGQDNGVLFLVSVGDRRVEIETGYGVEGILPDAKVGKIIQTEITPRFQQKDFDGGILNGTNALVRVLSGEEFAPPQIGGKPTASELSLYRFNFFFLIVGIAGFAYYYRVTLKKIAPISLELGSYSRNQYLTHPIRNWQIYTLVYLGCGFASTFVIIPVLATISRELLLAALVAIHFYWIIKIKHNPPSTKTLLIILVAPILFVLSSLLLLNFNVIGLVIIAIAIAIYQAKIGKDISIVKVFIFGFGSPIINGILLMLAGWIISNLFTTPESRPIVIFGLASSISLTYLSWEYLKQKFQFDGQVKVYCASCQQSLNLIDNILLQKYLKPTQKIAQQIGSVTYQGWQCPNCQTNQSNIHICADVVVKNAGKFQQCSTCQELTVTHTSKILKSATTSHSGIRLHTYTCQCCEYTHDKEEVIPRKSSSSSSSGYSSYSSDSGSSYSSSDGGSSSFGGGESGGGGAGGDW